MLHHCRIQWFVLVLLVCVKVSAFSLSKSFFVGPKSKDSIKLYDPSREISCEFDYRTSAGEKDNEHNRDEGYKTKMLRTSNQNIQDVESLLGKLSGVCIRKSYDFWKYEICFDFRITQSHGSDSYVIGTYAGMEKNLHVYKDGTACNALGGQINREGRIEFVCDEAFRLLSVEEIATCSYKLYVSTPLVCGHPDFIQNPANIPGATNINKNAPTANQPVVSKKNVFHMELAEMDDETYACSVQVVHVATKLTFQEFQLSITFSAKDDASLDLAGYAMRGDQRLSLKYASEFETENQKDGHRISMFPAPGFSGSLTYSMLRVRQDISTQ